MIVFKTDRPMAADSVFQADTDQGHGFILAFMESFIAIDFMRVKIPFGKIRGAFAVKKQTILPESQTDPTPHRCEPIALPLSSRTLFVFFDLGVGVDICAGKGPFNADDEPGT